MIRTTPSMSRRARAAFGAAAFGAALTVVALAGAVALSDGPRATPLDTVAAASEFDGAPGPQDGAAEAVSLQADAELAGGDYVVIG